MFELEARAPAFVRRESEDDRRADPFVMTREVLASDVRVRAKPAYFASECEPLDQHVFAVTTETQMDRAAGAVIDVAVFRPPTADALLRGECGKDRLGMRCKQQRLRVVIHFEVSG
ncbi:MAG: hypothetical protein ABI846_01880 [Rudaea sp.]